MVCVYDIEYLHELALLLSTRIAKQEETESDDNAGMRHIWESVHINIKVKYILLYACEALFSYLEIHVTDLSDRFINLRLF